MLKAVGRHTGNRKEAPSLTKRPKAEPKTILSGGRAGREPR